MGSFQTSGISLGVPLDTTKQHAYVTFNAFFYSKSFRTDGGNFFYDYISIEMQYADLLGRFSKDLVIPSLPGPVPAILS
jgi:hypothetical protein